MTPFSYTRPATINDALYLGRETASKYLGGGTNLVDLMRERLETPHTLIDVSALSDRIEERDGALFIGCSTRNTTVAAHPIVRTQYPLLSRAILAGASAQIRNMATVAGNVMQRTRCNYFYDAEGARCNKRVPGSGCDAMLGTNRYHAILGASASCVATHPSDMCIALAALDAIVHVRGTDGLRKLPFVDLHRLPEGRPDIDTVLAPGELITGIELPLSRFAARSVYRKVRDRSSFAFGIISVGAALDVQDGFISDIRIALGGVAHKPWRAFKAEQALRGGLSTSEAFLTAINEELTDAIPLKDNAFKVELVRRTVVAVLVELARKQDE